MSGARSSSRRAIEYLRAQRSGDSLWRDFEVLGVASSEWATAFVMECLGGSRDGIDVARESAGTLAAMQRPDGGWGFAPSWPSDCDSTAWACLALTAQAIPASIDVGAARRYMTAHQDPISGGFSTYAPSDAVERMVGHSTEQAVQGWCSPHTCVTALALRALARIAGDDEYFRLESAATYLETAQRGTGLWNSYWWRGVSYTTYQALRALDAVGRLSTGRLRAAQQTLLHRQSAAGAWSQGAGSPHSAFETAFALLTLMWNDELATGTSVRRAIRWLRMTQSPDGSWEATPILCTPAPTLSQPEVTAAARRRKNSRSFPDAKRLFTTAAAVCALDRFARLEGVKPGGRPNVTYTGRSTVGSNAERTVRDEVRKHLVHELATRGLLLSDEEMVPLARIEFEQGTRLWNSLVGFLDAEASVSAGSQADVQRLQSVLAFGATTAQLLGTRAILSETIEDLCATFNLGISMVDLLCDEAPSLGRTFLEALSLEDLREAVESPRVGPWLRGRMPLELRRNHIVVLASALVEVFFDRLHTVYPDQPSTGFRETVIVWLQEALSAQRASVDWAAGQLTREELVGCSRTKSVTPFRIIEALAAGTIVTCSPSPGVLIGTAACHIDDLIDICRDVHAAALNGVLMSVCDGMQQDKKIHSQDALTRVLASGVIRSVAAEAADGLGSGMRMILADGPATARFDQSRRSLLYFVRRWIG